MTNNTVSPLTPAPELITAAWINTAEPLKLSELRGKIVVLHAFQMLCPGCVSHGIPQASAIHNFYAHDDVQVIGLHTVFEHHQVMTTDALRVFVDEYRLTFPVAVDQPSDSGLIPKTMARYRMQGTPTLVIIDAEGNVRLQHFGRADDLQVGSVIGSLLAQRGSVAHSKAHSKHPPAAPNCDDHGCSLD